jgi:conserved hypothetical integral membrane protein
MTNNNFTATALTVMFGVSIAIANVSAAKLAFFDIPFLGGVAVPAGFVGIGVAFLCTDLLGELYGAPTARRAVNATVVALTVAWGLIYVAISMPAAPFFEANEAYATTLGAGGTIVLASIATTLVSQNIDVSVFAFLGEATNGDHAWIRNIGSTGVSQIVDTALFIVLAFAVLPVFLGGTTTPLAVLPELIVGQYVVKLAVAVLDTPAFYVIRRLADTNEPTPTADV